MKIFLKVFLFTLVSLSFFLSNGFAQVCPANVGDVTGTVTNSQSGVRVANATVSFGLFCAYNGNNRAVTDVNGNYTIRGLPEGWYDVEITAAGYQRVVVRTQVLWWQSNLRNFSIVPNLNAAAFVNESHQDGTDLAPNTNFDKRWTIRNSGTTVWNNTYCLRYSSDNVAG